MSQKHEPSQSSSTDGGEGAGHYKSGDGGHGGNYLKFLLMILTAGAVMYVVMYFNTYQFDHVYWSWTRFFMTMMSTATMAVIMLGFMLGMYKKKVVNLAIVGGAVVVFSLGLWLVRSQETIGDVAWMEAMIPHHSIAWRARSSGRPCSGRSRSFSPSDCWPTFPARSSPSPEWVWARSCSSPGWPCRVSSGRS